MQYTNIYLQASSEKFNRSANILVESVSKRAPNQSLKGLKLAMFSTLKLEQLKNDCLAGFYEH